MLPHVRTRISASLRNLFVAGSTPAGHTQAPTSGALALQNTSYKTNPVHPENPVNPVEFVLRWDLLTDADDERVSHALDRPGSPTPATTISLTQINGRRIVPRLAGPRPVDETPVVA